MTQTTPISLRWMIARDVPRVLAIDLASSPDPWREDQLISLCRKRNCVQAVAVVHVAVAQDGRWQMCHETVGFMFYLLWPHTVEVVRLAVHPSWRRQGVASALVGALKGKLSTQRRQVLAMDVPDANLGAHLFLRSQGFRAISVLAQAGSEYLYRFVYLGGA
jgi:ribosomal protein S18 acetylase RimI-like enzyme